MPWAKLDDSFHDHPKVVRAGNEAVGVFARGLAYCGRHLTDGEIPDAAAKALGSQRAIDALVDVGLWERRNGSYLVHDYLDYNRSRDKVRGERTSAKRRRHGA